jgi:deoxyribodipyrimidine photo-lyase
MGSRMSATLLWFRNDLRLTDHAALVAAVETGEPVIPVFIWSPADEAPWEPGAATRWWLHQSLESLDASLRAKGSRLILRSGKKASDVLDALISETHATRVVWVRHYEPAIICRDTAIKETLRKRGLAVESYPGNILFEPPTIKNGSGNPYQVFTPFWKACLQQPEPEAPLPAPRNLRAPDRWPASETLADWRLEPTIPWATQMAKTWTPGEGGARQMLKRFLHEAVAEYSDDRNRPDRLGTSRLSPHLHFGEISPRQIWTAAQETMARSPRGGEHFLRELGWREFAHYLLYHFPKTTHEPLRQEFSRFQWRSDKKHLRAWTRGMTGYPIIDAGMRELWALGWMHNRVRMIVGSFLVKDLLLSWQEGAAWFWDTLVDADLAQNTLGWQWISGCGADAAPYFRVFNPYLQGVKFDPQGDYVRRWVPELAKLPAEWIHQPSLAPTEVLCAAGVEIGKTYPAPLVDHSEARDRALVAFKHLKS